MRLITNNELSDLYRYCGQAVVGLLLGSSRSNDFYCRVYDRLERRVRVPIERSLSTVRRFVEADVRGEYDD